jgi:hypothetical protein
VKNLVQWALPNVVQAPINTDELMKFDLKKKEKRKNGNVLKRTLFQVEPWGRPIQQSQ